MRWAGLNDFEILYACRGEVSEWRVHKKVEFWEGWKCWNPVLLIKNEKMKLMKRFKWKLYVKIFRIYLFLFNFFKVYPTVDYNWQQLVLKSKLVSYIYLDYFGIHFDHFAFIFYILRVLKVLKKRNTNFGVEGTLAEST